jgi:hypothetical protein
VIDRIEIIDGGISKAYTPATLADAIAAEKRAKNPGMPESFYQNIRSRAVELLANRAESLAL